MRQNTTSLLPALEGAIHIFGGFRLAAVAADLDPSNLSKYVRHGAGISPEGIDRLERALGRPGGELEASQVLVLRPKSLNVHLAYALSWYFPNGAEIARASWSGFGWEHVVKVFKFDLAPEIYAFRNTPTGRVLVIAPAGLLLPRNLFSPVCKNLRWRGGEPERAELQCDDVMPWVRGELDVETFDAAWPGQFFDPSSEDVLSEVRRLKLSWSEAIRRLNHNR